MSGIVGGAGSKSGIIGDMGASNTHFSQWILDDDAAGDNDPLGNEAHSAANWVQINDTSAVDGTTKKGQAADIAGATDGKGKAVTMDSAIFTFPVTGFWRISGQFRYNSSTAEHHATYFIYTTTNNSTWTMVASGSATAAGSNNFNHGYLEYIFEVIDTANYKCKFRVDDAQGSNITRGYNSLYGSGATFIRLSGL